MYVIAMKQLLGLATGEKGGWFEQVNQKKCCKNTWVTECPYCCSDAFILDQLLTGCHTTLRTHSGHCH